MKKNPDFIVKTGKRKGRLQDRYLNSPEATIRLLKEVRKNSDVRRLINNANIPILKTQEKKAIKKTESKKEATSIQEINRRSAAVVARKNKRAADKRDKIFNDFLKRIGSNKRL